MDFGHKSHRPTWKHAQRRSCRVFRGLGGVSNSPPRKTDLKEQGRVSEFQSQSHRPAQEYWIPVQHRRLPRERFCEYPSPAVGWFWECLYITLTSNGAAAPEPSSTAALHLTVMYSSKLVLHTQNRVQPGRVANFQNPAGARFGTPGCLESKNQNLAKSQNLDCYGLTTTILQLQWSLCLLQW